MKWIVVLAAAVAAEGAWAFVPTLWRSGHSAAAAVWFTIGFAAMFAAILTVLLERKERDRSS